MFLCSGVSLYEVLDYIHYLWITVLLVLNEPFKGIPLLLAMLFYLPNCVAFSLATG